MPLELLPAHGPLGVQRNQPSVRSVCSAAPGTPWGPRAAAAGDSALGCLEATWLPSLPVPARRRQPLAIHNLGSSRTLSSPPLPGTLFLTEHRMHPRSRCGGSRLPAGRAIKGNSWKCLESQKWKALFPRPAVPPLPSHNSRAGFLRFSTQKPWSWEKTNLGMGRPGRGSRSSSHCAGCSLHLFSISGASATCNGKNMGLASAGTELGDPGHVAPQPPRPSSGLVIPLLKSCVGLSRHPGCERTLYPEARLAYTFSYCSHKLYIAT